MYGGQIEMWGAVSGPVWTHVTKTIRKRDSSLFVQGDVSQHWAPGDHIAVAPGMGTRLIADDSQRIDTVTYDASNDHTELTVNKPFNWLHQVGARTVRHPSGTRTYTLRPEVFKLNRHIQIRRAPLSTDLDDWWGEPRGQRSAEPDGAHFIIAHSAVKQVMHGVEFASVGQAGKLGR